jgi:6-phosphogluconolactonase
MVENIVRPDIRTYANLELAAHKAADLVEKTATWAIDHHGFFTLALAGGNTPRPLHELLAGSPYSDRLSWSDFYIFWGDERCLPPDRPESNFAMAEETLLGDVGIPAANVHRIRGELTPSAQAARVYDQELRDFFGQHPERTSGGFPRFDLVLLGMGPDGHTASLFPGSELLQEEEKWVAATEPRGEPKVARVTLTLPVLNNAENVLFLIAGTRKQTIMREIVDHPGKAARFPAARVQPKGRLFWFAAHE